MKKRTKLRFIIIFIVLFSNSVFNFVVADDSYEDNDNIYDAKKISTGFYNLTMEDNYDYFFIELEEFDILIVDLYFNSSISDLDLNIYDPDEIYYDSSSSSSNHEKVKTEVEVKGDYYIEVYNYDGINNDYNMTIDIEKGTPPDEYEDDELFLILFFIFIFGFTFGLSIIITNVKKFQEKRRLKQKSQQNKPSVSEPQQIAPSPHIEPLPPQPKKPLICPECGVKLEDDAIYCQFCGYKI
ncbi:MAG: zinc ribbon domain-containing protein [Promethearchaeota archaeon]